MNDKIVKLLDKAGKNIKVSAKLLQQGEDAAEIAVSRLYYAMFYCAEALLLSKGLSFSSHKGVIVNFAREFVKTGSFDEKFYRVLRDTFEDRQEADYEFAEFENAYVTRYLDIAREFLDAARKYLAGKENEQ